MKFFPRELVVCCAVLLKMICTLYEYRSARFRTFSAFDMILLNIVSV